MRSAASARELYYGSSERWYPEPRRASLWLERRPKRFAPAANTPPLAALLHSIDESRALLDLADGWDEADGPRLGEATWRKATEFLKRHARLLYARHGIVLPIPRIALGPDGSLDVHWKTDRRELLLNIPSEEGPAGFYGDAYGTNSIKGQLDVESSDPGLFTWLTITD